ncbi:MAG: L,D-transpeptidase [Acidobacteria bacterium]|nr:L,D-transpeptidase [Acidobacteriota bacterium]
MRGHRRALLILVATLVLFAALLIPRDTPPSPEALRSPLRRLVQEAPPGTPRPVLDENVGMVSHLQQQATIAVSRQSRRLPLLRGYTEARRLLATAAAAADEALQAMATQQASARQEAMTRIALAQEALLNARVVGARVHLQSAGRQALIQQEIALEEAQRNLTRGDYDAAIRKAGQVLAGSRNEQENAARTLARLRDQTTVALWRRWVDQTVAWSRRQSSTALVVDKAGHRLLLYDSGRLLTTFDVDLGLNPIPDKLHEGDNATPEGRYHVSRVRDGDDTRYHRAFLLDYPNDEDWVRFKQARGEGRFPPETQIGGLIEIHGYGGRGDDWTNGCVALTNPEMDFLDGWVKKGTPVTIVGALPMAPGDDLSGPAAGAGSPH